MNGVQMLYLPAPTFQPTSLASDFVSAEHPQAEGGGSVRTDARGGYKPVRLGAHAGQGEFARLCRVRRGK